MPFLILLLVALLNIAFLLLAVLLLTIGVPQVIADPDHFNGWLAIAVAAGLVFNSRVKAS